MKLEHQYRNECDILRLLVDELDRMCERYAKEHKEEIDSLGVKIKGVGNVFRRY